jgi:hypothetical protein
VRGIRIGLVLGLCAFACARQAPESATPAPGERTHTTAGIDAGAAAVGAAPGDGTASPSKKAEEPPSLEDLTGSLDRLEAELRAEGVRLRSYRKLDGGVEHAPRHKVTPSTKPTEPVAGEAAADDDPCPRICAIATTVCELRGRICTMADEHAMRGTPRHASAPSGTVRARRRRAMTVASLWRPALVVALLSLVPSCRKAAAPRATTTAQEASGGAQDDLDAVAAELANNAAALAALGVASRPDPGAVEKKRQDVDLDAAKPEPQPRDAGERPVRPENPAPPADESLGGSTSKSTTAAGAVDTCGRVCSLAGAACDLSQRICTLAEQHDGDARYEDLCWNAKAQCEDASDACADCGTC